ncbi:MAG: hypothetical protein H6953_12545 [Chromatiaceae bacterium]|nr:hypothetical protein [Chromatiaceae bacterium]MCP5315822.1 hypothetical protein [Chromatiaceae bacterium]
MTDELTDLGENMAIPADPQTIVPGAVAWRFKQADLVAQPLPKSLEGHLRTYGDWCFATYEPTAPPYLVEDFIDALLQAWPGDGLLIAHDGHGINSWALHYFLVLGSFACFLQLPWGGADMDANMGRERIRDAFAKVEAVIDTRYSAGERLIVIDVLAGRSFGKIHGGTGEIEWRESDDPLADVVDEIGAGGLHASSSNVIIPV